MSENKKNKYVVDRKNNQALCILEWLGYMPIYEPNLGESRVCGIAGFKDLNGKTIVRESCERPEFDNLYFSSINEDADIYRGNDGERIFIYEYGDVAIEYLDGLRIEIANRTDLDGFIKIMFNDPAGNKAEFVFSIDPTIDPTAIYYGSGSLKDIDVYDSTNEVHIATFSPNISNKWYLVSNGDDYCPFSINECNTDTILNLIRDKIKEYAFGYYYTDDFEKGLKIIAPALSIFVSNFRTAWANCLLRKQKEHFEAMNPKNLDPEYIKTVLEENDLFLTSAQQLLADPKTGTAAKQMNK